MTALPPTRPQPPLIDDGYLVEPDPLHRFREQRRQRRLGCGVAVLGLVAFWGVAVFVVQAVVAAPSAAPDRAHLSDAGPAAEGSSSRQGQRGAPHEAAVDVVDGRAAAEPDRPAGGAPLTLAAVTYSGVASWYAARGLQGAVPWWKPGQDPVWAAVTRFADGKTYAVTVLVTGWCQCLRGQPGERVIDLSDGAFRQLAPLSVGLIRVTVEVPVQGPVLPATDGEGP